MKKLLHVGLLLCLATTVVAQEKVLKVYDWKDLSEHIPNSQIVSIDGIPTLKIENTNNSPLKISLLKITDSSVIKKTGSISCEVKYENVFPNGNGSRFDGLPVSGSFQSPDTQYGLQWFCISPPTVLGGDKSTNTMYYPMSGTSNWRRYDFPSEVWMRTDANSPREVGISYFFQGRGTVYLRPIKLMKWVSLNSSNWWTPQQSGLIGGIGGSIIGCFGGLLGWLVSKGKARKFVLTATASAIVLGFLLTIGGLVAAILKQPYAVWYALLLPGVILVLVFSLNLHSIQRRYDELEIRRMTSMDTTGS
jgi:hypothetical protein